MSGQTLHVTGGSSSGNATNLIAFSGPIALSGSTPSTFDVQNTNTLALTGAVTSSAGLVVGTGAANSTGTLQLAGNNTSLTGGVTITSGTLQLGSPGALNSTAPNAVTFAGGTAGVPQVLQLNGNSVAVDSLNQAGGNQVRRWSRTATPLRSRPP